MADAVLIDTTFTAKNITAGFSVYELVVPGSGLVYKMRFQVRLVGVAGGGDYVINLRLNDGDVQTDDPMVPKTTYTAAAGVQNFWFPSISIDGMSGDAINIWVLGMADDNAVTGSIRIFYDDAVGVTTYGRSLDVAATGEAGLDFDNVKAATAPTTLTNITVPVVTTVNGLAAGAIPDDEIDAGAIKADAVTKIQAGLSTLTAAQVWSYATRTLTSLSALLASIVNAVLDELLSGHATAGSVGKGISDAATAGGTTPASLWAYTTRTLTQGAASVIAAVTGDSVTQYRDSSIYFSLTGLGSLAGRTKLYLTVKRDLDDEDSQALLQWEETAGLKYVNGAAATAADGSLTVDNATLGNITAKALASVAAALSRGNFKYDVKIVRVGDPVVYPLSEGVFTVKATATRARS